MVSAARINGDEGNRGGRPSGMSPEEWATVEALAMCHAMMSELPGLDIHRFDSAIQGLQEMVLALPAKRAIQCGG
ncbi:MAG TPA: hypothetical protein PK867_06210 [Pirellulales bacterium]|nr:hypothetical protein [Pirellulales bacterium]